MRIDDILRRQAAPTGRPDKPALVFDGQAISYASLEAHANRLAHALLALGVGGGDRVALFARNSPSWVATYFAVAKCGAILVPVNYWYRPAELAYVLRDSGARVCVLARALAEVARIVRDGEPASEWRDLATTDLRGRPALHTAVRPASNSVEHWIWLDERPDSAACPAAAHDPTVASLTAAVSGREPPALRAEPETSGASEPHIILYTSGTTGFPKGAVLSHRAHVLHAATFALHTGASEQDVFLNVYPLFHTGGIDCAVLPYLYVGATVVLLADPKPDLVLEAIEHYRVTAMMAVPTVWHRLVQHPDLGRRDLQSFARAMGSSDAMPARLLEQVLERFQASWTQTYGLTEAGCILTYLSPSDSRRKAGAAGKPHMQAEIMIADPDTAGDRDWPLRPEHRRVPGEVGEVVARTEHLMSGYWQNPEQSAAAVRNGWLRTGDLGRLDTQGYLYLAGRLKDVIISGGENIFPAEVEPILSAYPGVREVALVGVPDREWGESVLAVVVPQPASLFDADAFRAWARQRLAGYKTPRQVAVVDALPRTTGTGKVQKAALRERFRDVFGGTRQDARDDAQRDA